MFEILKTLNGFGAVLLSRRFQSGRIMNEVLGAIVTITKIGQDGRRP
jgi:hypothetical protein